VSFKAALLSGAKGGGSSYRNAPDNLRSTDTFELLVGLGTGRMRLAPGGLQNLFIDDVAVEDGQGKANFQDFAATLFDGDPTVLEPIKLQLGSSAGSNNVGLPITNKNTNAPGDWVTAAITQAGVDFIDLRFVVQQLYNQTKNGVSNATATIEVELRPSGSANWVNPLASTSGANYNQDGLPTTRPGVFAYVLRELFDEDASSSTGYSWRTGSSGAGVVTITGKTTSPYVKEYRVAVPNEGAYANKTWEIRCRLREIDYQVSGKDGENEVHRTISWESVAGAKTDPIGGDEAWRGLSYLQLFGKASDQITGIPEVKGIYDLDMYLVPPSTVWDPITRTYTGQAWDGVTTQLAWTQCPAWQIKGVIENDLSGVSALAPGSTLNKWDVLEASKWFAQQVPDGRGGLHPRYSMNWFIEQPQSVNELVNYLAGAVGSFAWDEGDGHWRLKAEKPETPQVIFTKENIAGEFVYQHTDIDTRFNDITAVYRDRDNRYEESRVRVFNQADIDLTGHRPTSIVLVGCDNRQEALRRAYIRLLTALNEKRMVTYKTNRIAGTLEPFSVVGIADGDLNSDSAIRTTGRIVGMSADQTRITVRDTLRLEPGIAYQVSLTVPNLGYTPDTTGEPLSTDWRKPTITITRNIVNTVAQRGDVYDLYLDAPLPANVPEFATVALSAPGLPALPKQYRVLGIQPEDNGEWATISAIEIYTSKWVESDNITEEALNAQVSSKIINSPVAPDTGMFRIDSYSTGIVNRRVLVTSWVRPEGRFIDGYRVQYRYNGGPWIVAAANTPDLFYELPDPAPGTYDFQIITIDRRGIESPPLNGSIPLDDNASIVPTGNLSRDLIAVSTGTDGTGGDFSTATGVFTVYGGVGSIDTADITYSVPNGEPWVSIDTSGVYHVNDPGVEQAQATLRAVWGTFTIDKTLNIVKTKQGRDGTDATLDTTPPVNATGLGLSSTVEQDAAGKPWIKLLAQWTASADPNLAGYTIAIREGIGGSFVEFDCGPLITSFYWQAQANTNYGVKIRAKNQIGVTSAYSAEVTHVTAHDITPPALPTSLTGTAAYQTVFLSWFGPTDADLAYVEVYENSTNNSATATRVATVANRPGAEGTFTRTGLAPNTTRYYWLKAIDAAGNRSGFTGGITLTTQQVFAQDISGQLADAQLAAVAASKVTGQLTDAQLADISAAKISGTITATQIADGSISGTKFASGLKPVEVVSALPSTGNTLGRTVILTTDGKLYRYTSTGWSASVATGDLVGTITNTQIADNAITSSKIQANSITATQIAANTITAGQIAADTITAANIAAGAITASELAANAVTAGKIAADAIVAANIQAGQITSAKIAADTITAANIAAGAITASELAAGSVTASAIAAGQISAGHIVAGSITGDRIAANSISATNIAAGTITGDKIAANSIAADRLSVASLSAITGTIGLLRTAASGARVEIESNQIRVYDSNNVMRVRLGVW
jgi:predicted phage tail protein